MLSDHRSRDMGQNGARLVVVTYCVACGLIVSQVPSVVSSGTGAEPPHRYALTYTLDHNEAPPAHCDYT